MCGGCVLLYSLCDRGTADRYGKCADRRRLSEWELNTLGTGDADLRFCVINVKDG
jgi:hypothetical protein